MIDKPLDTAVVLSFEEFSGKCLLLYHRPKKKEQLPVMNTTLFILYCYTQTLTFLLK